MSALSILVVCGTIFAVFFISFFWGYNVGKADQKEEYEESTKGMFDDDLSQMIEEAVSRALMRHNKIFTDKACAWLNTHRADEDHTMFYLDSQKDELTDDFIEKFRKGMEKL